MDRIVLVLGLVAGAVIALTVIPPIYYASLPRLSCSSGLFAASAYYDRMQIARSLEQPLDVIFAVGTIKHVETKAVDHYEPVHKVVDRGNYSDLEVVGYRPTGNKTPWKFVTMDVEKYVLDETGNFSEEIAFQTSANACYDNKSQQLVPLPPSEAALNPDNIKEFDVGDKLFVEILRLGDGALDSSGIRLPMDENDVVVIDPKRVLVPGRGMDEQLTLAEIKSHVTAEAAKIEGSP